MTISPIRNDDDHAEALARIDRLWGADPDSPEGRELEVLLTLVHAYEEAHHPIPPSDPISAIEFMAEQQGLSRGDLEPWIGSTAQVNDVMERRSPLTLPMIRRLSEGLGIPIDILVREYPLHRAA